MLLGKEPQTPATGTPPGNTPEAQPTPPPAPQETAPPASVSMEEFVKALPNLRSVDADNNPINDGLVLESVKQRISQTKDMADLVQLFPWLDESQREAQEDINFVNKQIKAAEKAIEDLGPVDQYDDDKKTKAAEQQGVIKRFQGTVRLAQGPLNRINEVMTIYKSREKELKVIAPVTTEQLAAHLLKVMAEGMGEAVKTGGTPDLSKFTQELVDMLEGWKGQSVPEPIRTRAPITPLPPRPADAVPAPQDAQSEPKKFLGFTLPGSTPKTEAAPTATQAVKPEAAVINPADKLVAEATALKPSAKPGLGGHFYFEQRPNLPLRHGDFDKLVKELYKGIDRNFQPEQLIVDLTNSTLTDPNKQQGVAIFAAFIVEFMPELSLALGPAAVAALEVFNAKADAAQKPRAVFYATEQSVEFRSKKANIQKAIEPLIKYVIRHGFLTKGSAAPVATAPAAASPVKPAEAAAATAPANPAASEPVVTPTAAAAAPSHDAGHSPGHDAGHAASHSGDHGEHGHGKGLEASPKVMKQIKEMYIAEKALTDKQSTDGDKKALLGSGSVAAKLGLAMENFGALVNNTPSKPGFDLESRKTAEAMRTLIILAENPSIYNDEKVLPLPVKEKPGYDHESLKTLAAKISAIT